MPGKLRRICPVPPRYLELCGQIRIRQALERRQKPKKEYWRYLSPTEAACKMALADSDKIKKSDGGNTWNIEKMSL